MLKIGDLDIAVYAIESERRIIVLEKVVDLLLESNSTITKPTKNDFDRFNKEALSILQQKYPNMGIELND